MKRAGKNVDIFVIRLRLSGRAAFFAAYFKFATFHCMNRFFDVSKGIMQV